MFSFLSLVAKKPAAPSKTDPAPKPETEHPNQQLADFFAKKGQEPLNEQEVQQCLALLKPASQSSWGSAFQPTQHRPSSMLTSVRAQARRKQTKYFGAGYGSKNDPYKRKTVPTAATIVKKLRTDTFSAQNTSLSYSPMPSAASSPTLKASSNLTEKSQAARAILDSLDMDTDMEPTIQPLATMSNPYSVVGERGLLSSKEATVMIRTPSKSSAKFMENMKQTFDLVQVEEMAQETIHGKDTVEEKSPMASSSVVPSLSFTPSTPAPLFSSFVSSPTPFPTIPPPPPLPTVKPTSPVKSQSPVKIAPPVVQSPTLVFKKEEVKPWQFPIEAAPLTPAKPSIAKPTPVEPTFTMEKNELKDLLSEIHSISEKSLIRVDFASIKSFFPEQYRKEVNELPATLLDTIVFHAKVKTLLPTVQPVTGALFTNSFLSTKQSDTWTCSVCLVPNTMSAEKCIACTSEKPKSTLSKTNRTVKSSGSGWTCNTCLVPNKAEASQCIACETPK